MPDADGTALDQAVLSELKETTGDDPAFVRDLIETYLADVPVQLEGIEAAVAANDAEALIRPAHTLKSSSATVGAMRLAETSRALDMAGRTRGFGAGGRAPTGGPPGERERGKAAFQ